MAQTPWVALEHARSRFGRGKTPVDLPQPRTTATARRASDSVVVLRLQEQCAVAGLLDEATLVHNLHWPYCHPDFGSWIQTETQRAVAGPYRAPADEARASAGLVGRRAGGGPSAAALKWMVMEWMVMAKAGTHVGVALDDRALGDHARRSVTARSVTTRAAP